jgi:hypothetical protein
VGSGKPIEGKLDVARFATIVGQDGEQTGAVYKITIGRPDIPLKEMGAVINARMGLKTAYSGVPGLEFANRKETPPLTDDAPSIHVSEKLRLPPI